MVHAYGLNLKPGVVVASATPATQRLRLRMESLRSTLVTDTVRPRLKIKRAESPVLEESQLELDEGHRMPSCGSS